ncbi:cytochrome b5 [Cladochytrium replicatum]|nr:cytochrome b5 [Cladochytrium replicatum]
MASLKTFEWTDVAAHNKRKDTWMVIDGKVYDITKFLDEHPGGEEVLLEQAGIDATEAFDEIGHSDDAKELLKTYLIGQINSASVKVKPALAQKPAASGGKSKSAQNSGSNGVLFGLIPVAAILAYVVYQLLANK